MTEEFKTKFALMPMKEFEFKLDTSSFAIGVKADEDGELYFNGNLNVNGIDNIPKKEQMRFLDLCRGFILALAEHPHVFELLGKQERSTMMKFMRDKLKPNISHHIEKLKDSNVVKVEFGANEEEV